MSSSTNFDNHVRVSSSAIDAHLNNIRNRLPPPLQVACFPDSTSSLARNIILVMIVVNAFLFLVSLTTIGTRFMGSAMLLASFISCCHTAVATMLLGSHFLRPDNQGGIGLMGMNNIGLGDFATRMGNYIRHASQRYGSNPFAYGSLFGATVVMALVMHIESVYFGGVSSCVSKSLAGNAAAVNAVTNATSGSAYHLFSNCGASGAVGLVSFLTGLLFWLEIFFALVLYAGREELMSEALSYQYDEIGVGDSGVGRGFDGDFPLHGSSGTRTMQV
mmetsp:Transcript_13792/g.29114  ORF Transcript_13792/g.29114 Transcript_13792/m.29114 type:complete len:275 (+) Transcript_13792:406-1230(+)